MVVIKNLIKNVAILIAPNYKGDDRLNNQKDLETFKEILEKRDFFVMTNESNLEFLSFFKSCCRKLKKLKKAFDLKRGKNEKFCTILLFSGHGCYSKENPTLHLLGTNMEHMESLPLTDVEKALKDRLHDQKNNKYYSESYVILDCCRNVEAEYLPEIQEKKLSKRKLFNGLIAFSSEYRKQSYQIDGNSFYCKHLFKQLETKEGRLFKILSEDVPRSISTSKGNLKNQTPVFEPKSKTELNFIWKRPSSTKSHLIETEKDDGNENQRRDTKIGSSINKRIHEEPVIENENKKEENIHVEDDQTVEIVEEESQEKTNTSSTPSTLERIRKKNLFLNLISNPIFMIIVLFLVITYTKFNNGIENEKNDSEPSEYAKEENESEANIVEVSEELKSKSEFYYVEGLVKFQSENFEGAITDLSKAIELNPKHPNAHYFRGFINSNKGVEERNIDFLESAIADFSKFIQLDPSSGLANEAYKNRGNTYRNLGIRLGFTGYAKTLFKTAIDDFSKRIDLTEDSEAQFKRGTLYTILNETEKAIEDYSAVIKMNPLDGGTFLKRIGFVEDSNLHVKELKAAINDFSKVIDSKKDDPELFFNRGFFYTILNEADKAIKDYSTAIKLNPQDANAFLKKSECFFLKEMTMLGIKDLEKAIELDPILEFTMENHTAFNMFKIGYQFFHHSNFEKAIEYLTKSLESTEKIDEGYYLRGYIHHYLGLDRSDALELEKAMQDYNYFLEANPKNPEQIRVLKESLTWIYHFISTDKTWNKNGIFNLKGATESRFKELKQLFKKFAISRFCGNKRTRTRELCQ